MSVEGSHCFYCDVELAKIDQKQLWFRRRPDHAFTVEHLIPQVALRPYIKRIPNSFLRLNKVAACHKCNNAKGDMDPVDWARQLGPQAVARMATRFIEMGVPADYVALVQSGRAALNVIIDARAA